MPFCEECGKQMGSKARYCSYCGMEKNGNIVRDNQPPTDSIGSANKSLSVQGQEKFVENKGNETIGDQQNNFSNKKEKYTNSQIFVGILLMSLFFAGVFFQASSNSPNTSSANDKQIRTMVLKSENAPTYLAEQVISLYNSNAVAWEERYNQKILTVTGRLYMVYAASNDPNTIIASLSSYDGKNYGYLIQVQFREATPDIKSRLAGLSRGQVVRARGYCFKASGEIPIFLDEAVLVY